MYKKRNNKPLVITIMVMAVVLGVLAGLTYLKKQQDASAVGIRETETEAVTYDVLLYKTSEAIVEFDSHLLKSDAESEVVLEVEQDTLVTLLVTPNEGKHLESVDVVDFKFNEVNNFLRETSTDTVRVNFVMPDTDIIINFNLSDIPEAETESTLSEVEMVEDTEMSETSPYGLTLHGVTADIIVAYNGQFDDRDFLQQLGDALHMDSARSDYQEVTDVTFSSESYTGTKDSDKVYHYIYFNENPEWKVLSTYYLKEGAYVFTEPVTETESETVVAEPELSGGNTIYGGSSGSTYNGSFSGGGYTTPVQTITTTTALDIMQVSKTFLAFTGDEEKFYEQVFQYVQSEGLTGSIVGTMSEYKIFPEKKKATFRILLSTGVGIKGIYNKTDDSYEFSGL